MYGTKWSNLIYILVFWLQITVRTVACIVYEPVSRNIKQIYEHGNIYKIKWQNHFKGFLRDRKYGIQWCPLFSEFSILFKTFKPVEEKKYFQVRCFDKTKSYGVWSRDVIDFYIKWVLQGCKKEKVEYAYFPENICFVSRTIKFIVVYTFLYMTFNVQ